MKSLNIIKSLFVAVVMLLAFTMSAQNNMKEITEVANKGKQDLLEVLKSGRDLNLGVSAEELEGASAGTPVKRQVLQFDALMKLDSNSRLSDIVDKEASMTSIVPFVKGSEVVTVVEVAEAKGELRLAGLGGMSLSSDLSAVMRASGSKNITAYEVPNLQTMIYAVGEDKGVKYYTSFQGNSIRQAVPASLLLPAVQAAAERFQKEYGSVLQKEQLVR